MNILSLFIFAIFLKHPKVFVFNFADIKFLKIHSILPISLWPLIVFVGGVISPPISSVCGGFCELRVQALQLNSCCRSSNETN